MKKCIKCGKSLDVSQFRTSTRNNGTTYTRGECRACERKRAKKQKPRTRDQKVSRKKWNQSAAGKKSVRFSDIKSRYGMSKSEYESLYMSQGGKCAICGKKEIDAIWGTLTVDHDHKTKTIRGLLCSNCNMGIGQFNDDIDIMASAISYLRGFARKALEDVDSTQD